VIDRKEVIVAGKVFDLGLKGLADAVAEGERAGQTVTLAVGARVFQVAVSRQERALILHWTGMTNSRNIVWMRFTALKLEWPPVKALSCFTFASEDL